MPHTMVDRRTFLARTGVLGLALAAPPGLLARADANPAGDAIEELVRWLRPQLRNLAIETYEGLAAFVAPGDDRFSALQHQRLPGPGGVAAGAGRFTLDTIDGYLPVPDRIWIPTMLRSRSTTAHHVPVVAGLKIRPAVGDCAATNSGHNPAPSRVQANKNIPRRKALRVANGKN